MPNWNEYFLRPTAYDVLGVAPNANTKAIDAAYARVIQNIEAESNRTPDYADGQAAKEGREVVDRAYDLLSPQKRQAYDAQLKQHEFMQSGEPVTQRTAQPTHKQPAQKALPKHAAAAAKKAAKPLRARSPKPQAKSDDHGFELLELGKGAPSERSKKLGLFARVGHAFKQAFVRGH